MTPEAARDRKLEGQDADFEGHYVPRNSPKFKKRGSWMTPKAVRNPKLGVIFATYAPMTPCPPLAQPLVICVYRKKWYDNIINYLWSNKKIFALPSSGISLKLCRSVRFFSLNYVFLKAPKSTKFGCIFHQFSKKTPNMNKIGCFLRP